ncbi:3-methyladenine DNA glycosylase [Antrihabitans sp. YC3-6]|uniref:3-methyladenine DNA glycosylase n=1 Tax=Antrihabitans stalagmiti TaxID=2799499 RepID=A0A934NMP9_9NOCA|nr:3-methyladenine DNA glycosylase [Antrihabitans stalagmiti]MBJ8337990.1 3-methyladenine DNA glycosylase [Antrihabitans stalagmiti]
MEALTEEVWTARRDRHAARVTALIDGPDAGTAGGRRSDPVVDFLFTYYSQRPAQLRRWHPGFGVELCGPSAGEYSTLKGYRPTEAGATADHAYLEKRRSTVEFVAALLSATAARPTNLGCFGLHEWAMVYRGGPEALRHSVSLRLGHDGTDAVVESMNLRCTHYDAFRFFTPAAEPRNIEQLTRGHQIEREQPGCLHASMDLYKWCYKLSPLVDSDLVLDCFELALAARELDMRASPYDLSSYGYAPVPIETAAGRAEYVRGQAALAERSVELRSRLLARIRGWV